MDKTAASKKEINRLKNLLSAALGEWLIANDFYYITRNSQTGEEKAIKITRLQVKAQPTTCGNKRVLIKVTVDRKRANVDGLQAQEIYKLRDDMRHTVRKCADTVIGPDCELYDYYFSDEIDCATVDGFHVFKVSDVQEAQQKEL